MKSRKKQKRFESTGKLLAVGLFCLIFLPLSGFAKTLAEYRESVRSARSAVQELTAYVDDALDEIADRDADFEREILAGLRRTLPATEKVEWEGTAVETGNQWLEARLKAFEEETGDWTARRQILTEIGERLAAIETKINELSNPALSDRSKDEEKRKLAEILRRPEYQKPEQQEESWFQRMQRRIKEWFDRKFPRPEVPDGAPEGFQSISFGLQMLLYAVVLGFIAFLIYRFAPLFAGRFRRRDKGEKGDRVILGERLGENENAQTLFDEAEALARGGNLRGAIRKGYIALLCELSDRRVIGLAQHKTNRDYLRDVRKKGELYKNMNGLTRSFERHWYGFDEADETDWNEFKQTYRQAVKNE